MINAYTERGWKVFPLTKNTKTPATQNGFKDASTDPHTIKQGQNVGIATGKGLLVLDIDRKHGKDGGDVLKALEAEHGVLPDTLTASTPSGGEHLYFSYPAGVAIQSRANICKEHGEGLDIRADGGYIVAPPSRTEASADPKGKTATGDYVWANSADVAELPAAWLELLRTKERTRNAPEPRNFTPTNDRMAELQDAMGYLPADDYDLWVSVGKALFSLGNSGFELWDTWSRNSDKYNGREMPNKWQSFASGAAYEPAFIFAKAQEYGWQNPAKKTRNDRWQQANKPQGAQMDSNTQQADEGQQEQSVTLAFIRDAIAKLDNDPGAVFERDVIGALLTLSTPDLARVMAEIKAKKAVSMTALQAEIKRVRGSLQGESNDKENSIAAQVVDFVNSRAELFVDQDNEPYARIDTGGRWETWRLESQGFREWVSAELYRSSGILPKADPLKDACAVLAGSAKYAETPIQRNVYLRAGKTESGAYAIDLCNHEWQAVIVEPGKWWLDTVQTVPFRRAATNKELPTPLAAGAGSVDALWDLINVKESDRNMLLAWMLECWRPDTAYPVCEIGAEQGSGKSSAQAVIRKLIDPNAANLRGKPKNPEDIYVAAYHSLMVSYENLSHLTDDMQDAFCVLATGGGMAGRTLHTNFEESVMTAKRPIIMNGISILATRQDLVDRLVNLDLLPINPAGRKTDSELVEMFDAKAATIFTGLLDLFAKALEILPTMQIDELPRMADFALFGSAVYAARGVVEPEKAFMADYSKMREDAIFRTLDSSPVAQAIMTYLDNRPEGAEFMTAKEALDAMAEHRGEGEAWPRSPKGFAEALKRLAPAFRQIGIRAETSKIRGERGYPVIIKPIRKQAAPCSVSPIGGNVVGML